MAHLPTTVDFPAALEARRDRDAWRAVIDGVELRLSNLDKVFWQAEGYTKGDVVAYYLNAAPWVLPYVRDRPLTMKRMPDGADGDFFYEKQVPSHAPAWVQTAAVTSRADGKTIDYILAGDRPTLAWLANLGCIELHPWHSRIDAIGRPDYAFFDLDPFDVDFAAVREVALLVRDALEHLGLRGHARTSGATGMQVYVPIDRVHSHAAVRAFVRSVCRAINAADPERTTMAWEIADRSGKVFLDAGMNTEGRNIAATYSLRPERGAPVATPLKWDEVASDVEPRDFTIATIWARLAEIGDRFATVLEGGQDLRAAMSAVGLDPEAVEAPPGHDVEVAGAGSEAVQALPGGEVEVAGAGSEAVEAPPGRDVDVAAPGTFAPSRLAAYADKRDFARTPEPPAGGSLESGDRFVIQHHLARRLHHDLRLEREGVAVSWAVPKGLPDEPGTRRLAVQTEDHPLAYMDFEGEIPQGAYGAGAVRIWDAGTYECDEWTDGKVRFRLHGRRHRGTYHLFRTEGGDSEQWLVIRVDQPQPDEMVPDPPSLRPMLAVATLPPPLDDPEWWFEVKWDGMRILATTQRPDARSDGRTLLRSRQGNDVSAAYPELASLWERVLARNAVLDGEVVATDDAGRPSFQLLQRRMHRRDAAEVARLASSAPVTLMVFDLLFVDGESLCELPLRERAARLDDVLVDSGRVQRSQVWHGEGGPLLEAARDQGLEGVVGKRADSPYRPGARSSDWRKLKVRRDADVVVGGWLAGEGGRAGHLGALLVGAYDDEGALRYLGRVGTGFDGAELRRLGQLLAERSRDESPFADAPRDLPRPHWVNPDLVSRVTYAQLTDDQRLRAASYKGLRPDAEPRDCALDAVAE